MLAVLLSLLAHGCGGAIAAPPLDPVPPPPRLDAAWLAQMAPALRAEMRGKRFVFVVGAHHAGP